MNIKDGSLKGGRVGKGRFSGLKVKINGIGVGLDGVEVGEGVSPGKLLVAE